jgi:GH25 family lysozyme M1 (1,4-beta-N-acetylmuramidase)
VWLAEYDAEVPTAPLDFSIWQYTNAGTVPGIPTDVDLNVWLEPQK